MKKIINTARREEGFTLVELLLVIAVIGVLAVVVLLAINPVQQLAKTRDAGRMSSVQQLGHAVEAYTVSNNSQTPANLTALVTAGEINDVPEEIPSRAPDATAACAENEINGFCYDDDGTYAVVYTPLEAQSNITKCGAAATAAYASYSTADGRSGITCGVPNPGTNTFVAQ